MAITEQTRERIIETEREGLELGSFARPPDDKSRRSSIIVASYNIRYAVGSFLISGSIGRRLGLKYPSRRPRLVARHIDGAARALSDGRRLPPVDILALQEVDRWTARAGRHDVARELARELRMNYARAAITRPVDEEEPKSKQWYLDFEEHIPASDDGDTGVAILSRLPLWDAARIELPWSDCAWRPRLALFARIQNGEESWHIFNSHIDPHAEIEGQLEQHAPVLKRAAELPGPVILLGDFNTLSRRSCLAMRRLLESHGYTTPFPTGTATWRAGLIRLHTDWIFVRGAKVLRWGVARRLSVSDHWPVWAEIAMSVEAASGA